MSPSLSLPKLPAVPGLPGMAHGGAAAAGGAATASASAQAAAASATAVVGDTVGQVSVHQIIKYDQHLSKYKLGSNKL